MPVVGLANPNLCFFRLIWTWGWNDFIYDSGHGNTRLFSLPRIHVQHGYSCGPGHARLCHFLLDAGKSGAGGLFLRLFTQHTHSMTTRCKSCSSILHSGGEITA